MNITLDNIVDVKIYEDEYERYGTLFINFCLDKKTNFYLGFRKSKNGWRPLAIQHARYNKIGDICHICKKEIDWDTCPILNEYRITVGNLLLSHPNVRLKVLFM